MIKYPVKVGEFDDELGGYTIYDREGNVVIRVEEHTSSYDAEGVANIVANALNAMHEFPKPLHEKPDKITFSTRLFGWYDKFINPAPRR